MLNRRQLLGAALASSLVPSIGSVAGAATRSGHPVVVELFTSQGCSSCPPADALLGELSGRDDVITLGYHVDYWDYIGWADPFADPLFTSRQRRYATALGNRTIYTPQMVLDGTLDRVGSRRFEVEASIDRLLKANLAERISVPVELAHLSGGSVGVSVPMADVPAGAAVFMAASTSRYVTEIKRGENSGRTLVDFDVVRRLAKVGDYAGRAVDWAIAPESFPKGADRLAVWLQAAGNGPIMGAAKLDLPSVG
jgi:hypothetical protein